MLWAWVAEPMGVMHRVGCGMDRGVELGGQIHTPDKTARLLEYQLHTEYNSSSHIHLLIGNPGRSRKMSE